MTDHLKTIREALDAIKPPQASDEVLRMKWAAKAAVTALEQAMRKPWTARELELIDGMIEAQMHHAEQCDRIGNRTMAEKQKGWDLERVALLQKIRAAPPAQQAQPSDDGWKIDYDKLIADAFANHKYAQGTRECVAFKCGAEWAMHNYWPAIKQAQAVPLLTDEQIQTAWVEHGLDDCAVEDFARAIESMVRSKLGAGVPMTREDRYDAFTAAERAAGENISPWSFDQGVRAAERHHGIVGKEGGK